MATPFVDRAIRRRRTDQTQMSESLWKISKRLARQIDPPNTTRMIPITQYLPENESASTSRPARAKHSTNQKVHI
jgi:hypothetical protein